MKKQESIIQVLNLFTDKDFFYRKAKPESCERMNRIAIYQTLFSSMLSISAFTFGGGSVIIPLMRKKMVEELAGLKKMKCWIFADRPFWNRRRFGERFTADAAGGYRTPMADRFHL